MYLGDPYLYAVRSSVYASNICAESGQQVRHEFSCCRLQAEDEVGAHAGCPDISAAVGKCWICPVPRNGRNELLDGPRLSVKHAELVGIVLTEPETILGIHEAATWSGIGRWGWVKSDMRRLCVDHPYRASPDIRKVAVSS